MTFITGKRLSRRTFILCLAVSAAACSETIVGDDPGSPEPPEPDPLGGAATLGEALLAGGFVIWWRHGEAIVCEDRRDLGIGSETHVFEWWKSCDKDCSTALVRQMSPQGVTEAQTIGAAVKARGFPFGRVISSEYCRCFESAELMDLGPAIETSPQVTYFVYTDIILSRCAVASGLLSQVPAAGTNTAIVAHNYPDCIGSGGPDLGLENGQAAIFRPDGAGLTTFIAKVNYDEWTALP